MTQSDPAVARKKGFRVTALVYLVALAAAAGTVWLLGGFPLLLKAAAADLAATLVVFAFSAAYDNSSLYDPYWSVATLPLGVYWALPANGVADRERQALALTLVALWAVRLTWNWARGWRGLAHEDWRYRDIRAKTGRCYWPVSLLGIHLMPTAMVFGGCVPLYFALTTPGQAFGGRPFGGLDVLAGLVTAAAIWIEATADSQLRKFARTRKRPEQIMAEGLWAYSRHPNYFGEVLFWWGVGLFGLAADPGRWWVMGGPLAISLLFVFISIPMMDKHMLASRPAYAERKKLVSRLVPWFPKSEGGEP